MKLLYICTHNRCRSILSEAITQQRAAGLIEARSAGSSPAGQVHPMTLHHLEQQGYATHGLRSKSWGDFADWKPDVVITVCDRAAQEPCPLYFGRTHQLHWSLADPSAVAGSEQAQAEAFLSTISIIEKRVEQLITIANAQESIWVSAFNTLIKTEIR